MIDGFAIGHHTADGAGWLIGATVVLARDGAVGGVDVRGGGPGTRETDLLDPTALVEQVHAVLLTGGSAYGLAAADGVMAGLEELGVGFPVGPDPAEVVPIVPAAVIFDLGRGGVFGHRPTADFGRRALGAAAAGAGPGRTIRPAAASARGPARRVAGSRVGGFGYAELTLADGARVAAAVVVNAAGSAVDPVTGRLWSDRRGLLAPPTVSEQHALRAAQAETVPSFNTTIGVVLTDATLTKAQSGKVAAVAHDGLARAVRPVHSMSDGDTIFCLASGRHARASDPRAALAAFDALLSAAADVFTDACYDALTSADARGSWSAFRDLVPSAFTG